VLGKLGGKNELLVEILGLLVRFLRYTNSMTTEKMKAYDKKRHQTPQYRQSKKEQACKRRDFVREQKVGKQCARCGEDDTTKLVFHHRDPATKLFDIGRFSGRTETGILEEIAKCDILCNSCHVSLHRKLRK